MRQQDAYHMPKIDLHCHLDGSMRVELVQKLLYRQGEAYSIEELSSRMKAPRDCRSLAQYLEAFDLPIRCLQTKEGLCAAAEDLALCAAKENVKYMEVRFAPSFSTQQGLRVQEILTSVLYGLASAKAKTGICTGVIVCGMRNLDMQTNLSMLKEARELYGQGVVACDLAGDEKAYPTAEFAEFFETARRYGMPYTIHSGECGSRENIRMAIELGASRLGHGIAMKNDAELIRQCARKRIGVELCPTSNLQTKAVQNLSEYPFLEFYRAGIPVSINTDNRTVSSTTSTDELMRLVNAGMMDERIGEHIYQNSVEMSFAPDGIKHTLLSEFYK